MATFKRVRTKVEGSGKKKGYIYATPMPEQHRKAISRALKGRDITWSDKIRETYKDNNGLASNRIREAWAVRPREWVITDIITGEVFKEDNLKQFCESQGFTDSHLCRIAGWHAGKLLDGNRYYRGRYDCWNEQTKVIDHSVYKSKFRITDRQTGEQWFYDSLKEFGEMFNIPLSTLYKSSSLTKDKGINYKIRKNSPRYLVYLNK